MGEETRIATETLAELYLKAQNIGKAYEIYQQLLSQNPNSIRYRKKVRELELRLKESGGISSGESELSIRHQGDIERSIGELKAWLKRIQRAKKKST
jgi:tetratricopeptide (TPR) repeat protein